MIIREGKESEINDITDVHDQAFGAPMGNFVKNLSKNNNLIISLVAEIDGKIIGHIAYSPMYNKEREIIGLGIGPVGVLPSFQKHGIGSKLTEKGNEIAWSKGINKIFVLGDSKYYCSLGFELASNYNYFTILDPTGSNFLVIGEELKKELEKTFVDYGKEFNA
jgi:putative acetyltransferase